MGYSERRCEEAAILVAEKAAQYDDTSDLLEWLEL
jgi:hypothetical protein